MASETSQNTARMSKCPSFDGCSAPICPLDELQSVRVKLPDEPNCKATKRTRLQLGADLPLKGLTKLEYSNAIRFYGGIEAYQERLFSKSTICEKKQNGSNVIA